LGSKLAIQTGILYTQLGTKLEVSNSKNRGTTKFNFNYFQIHGHFQFKHEMLLLHAVPYYSYILGAKVEYDDGKTEKFKKKDWSEEVADLGIGFGAALVINDRCQIGVGYDTGLKNRNLMATLTFMFGK
jgi:hypothetical protein